MKLLLLYLKGMAMGIADLVPGISGGTVALLTGIYERLVRVIAQLNWDFVKTLMRWDYARLMQHYQMGFFVVLISGLASGVILGAPIIHHLLVFYRPITYAFFAGLICASLVTMINRDTNSIFFVIGASLGLLLLTGYDIKMSWTPINIFWAGSIAICAMILPGISGSFILLLLGMYQPLITALVSLDLKTIVLFATGALIGILIFSRLVYFMLNHYYAKTLSVLLGMTAGSLIQLWPWQQDDQRLLLPFTYSQLTSQDNYVTISCVMFVIGCMLIWLLNRLSSLYSRSP